MVDEFQEYIQYLNDMIYHYDAEISGTDWDNVSIKINSNDQFEYNPIITSVKCLRDTVRGTTYTYLIPVIAFPTIDTMDFEYADSLEYLMKRWEETVGKMFKYLTKYPYTEGMFSDDEY